MSKKPTSGRRIHPRLVAGAADPSTDYTASVRRIEEAMWKRLPLVIRNLINKKATSIQVDDESFYAFFDRGQSLIQLEVRYPQMLGEMQIYRVDETDDIERGFGDDGFRAITISAKDAANTVRYLIELRERTI